VGYTSGGVNLVLTAERMDIVTDQSYAPVGVHKVTESFEIRTSLAETTLENLKIVWEQTEAVVTGVGTKSLSWGMNPDIVEHTLVFEGKSPEGFARTFTCHKAVVWEVGETPHMKDSITVIPCTFRVLPDITKGVGKEYGDIVDTTA